LIVVVVVIVGAVIVFYSRASTDPTTIVSTTTSSSTPSTTSTTVTTSEPASVTISAVGDTELGNTPQLPSDPVAYFEPVKAALAAPIVFGNLEGTMTDATTSKCSPHSTQCYAFRVPPSYAAIYHDVGFTVLNAANNHSFDFGSLGAVSTTAALRAVGIAQAGLPGEIGVVRDGTLKVAFVDFAPYENTNDLLNFPAASTLIAHAQTMANIVVVYMHAGAEGATADHVTRSSETFSGENRGNPYAFAHAAIDDGADLVIASGPHVLRGMQWYHGHLIDYSLGDFTNYEDFSASGDLALSGILRVTLSASGSVVAGHFTSILLQPNGQAFVDPSGSAASFVNQLSKDDFGSEGASIEGNGNIALP
jgi:hypothetical protein